MDFKILGIILIAIVIVSIIAKPIIENSEEKSKQRKKEDALNAWIRKIKEKEALKQWINDITVYCADSISQHPERDQSFEFVAYNQDFAFGHNLQKEYLVHVKDFVYPESPIVVMSYNFSQYNLPELEGDIVANNFSKAFAEIVKEELKKAGADVEVRGKNAIRNSDGSQDYNEDTERFIYYIEYTRKKVAGSW